MFANISGYASTLKLMVFGADGATRFASCRDALEIAIAKVEHMPARRRRGDRIFKTLHKWQKEKKAAAQRRRAASDSLRPLEDEIYRKVEQMEKKLFTNLKRRHAAMYDTEEEAFRQLGEARTNMSNARLRIATKYGWERPPRRSSMWVRAPAWRSRRQEIDAPAH